MKDGALGRRSEPATEGTPLLLRRGPPEGRREGFDIRRVVAAAARSSARARLGFFFAAASLAMGLFLCWGNIPTTFDGARDVVSMTQGGAGSSWLWGSSRRDHHHQSRHRSHDSKSPAFHACELVRHALLELEATAKHERERERHNDHHHSERHGRNRKEAAQAKQFHGQILYPDSRKDARQFDASVKVWNERYNSRRGHDVNPPCAAVLPSNEDDVALIVPLLVRHGANIIIKSGGHCYADYSSASSTSPSASTSSDAEASPNVLLDLAHLNDLHFAVDGGEHRDTVLATMGPGTTMGQILRQKGLHDDLSSRQGHSRNSHHSPYHHDERNNEDYYYAGVLGSGSEVAAGGYMLGGGYGYWSRKHGLAIDNVRL
jgi:hypothetical protein